MLSLKTPAYQFVYLDHILRIVNGIARDVLVEAIAVGGQTIFCYISRQDAADFMALQAERAAWALCEQAEDLAAQDATADAEALRTELERGPWPR